MPGYLRILYARGHCLTSIINEPSSPMPTWIDSGFSPSAIRPNNCREISGSSVLVRMLSTLRAPLSTSVQRRATSSISAGS